MPLKEKGLQTICVCNPFALLQRFRAAAIKVSTIDTSLPAATHYRPRRHPKHLRPDAHPSGRCFFAQRFPLECRRYSRRKGMTWIKTVSMEEDERVAKAMLAQRALYPIEYATPVHPVNDGQSSSIVASHSLIPDALFHAFSTFGALMSPDLPLDRRKHEMITTVVSVTNRCHY